MPDYINAMGEYNKEMFKETNKNIPVLSATHSFEGVENITSAHAFHTGALKNLSSYAYDNFHLRLSATSLIFSFLAICIVLTLPLYFRTNRPLSLKIYSCFLFSFICLPNYLYPEAGVVIILFNGSFLFTSSLLKTGEMSLY
jgi:hypothetical protein